MDSSNLLPFLKHYKLLFLVLIGFLDRTRRGLAAGHTKHPGSRLSVELPDFISIDCGAPEDYIDNTTGVPYKSDKYLIDSGLSKPISSKLIGKFSPQFNYLRFFPKGRRNCYTLKPKAGKYNNYLIRASFFYGNYDGKFQPPQFDLYLGVNLWQTVKWVRKRIEVNLVISSDFIDVCLVNVGKGVPFISALELRRLDNSIYRINNGVFVALWSRYDVGGIGQDHVRYSDDIYDRMWKPSQLDSTSSISTNATINMSKEDSYRLPELMLKTAGQAQNSTSPLTYTWKPSEGSFGFFFCFHFAETEKLKAGQFREISIGLNDVHTIAESVKLEYLQPKTVCSKTLPVNVDKQNYVSVSATSRSNLPPILNGIEIFYPRELSNSSTFLQDINALTEVKQKYKMGRNWQGDPCNPIALSWDGLICSDGNPSRVISINLSWRNLTGDIAISFSNLTALESLDLSNNQLGGHLPEFLAHLPRLKMLNLMGNNFTGIIPEALIQKSKNGTLILSLEINPELCLSPPCKKKRKSLIPVLSSVISATILGILFSFLVILTRNRRAIGIYFESKKRRRLEIKNNQLFSYLEILSITDNFKTIIGSGGFGKVYLGKLKDQTPVAVKLLSASSNQGYNEFQAEARLLMIVHHRNLVSLVGYCDEDDHKALIYEYMANGNVHQHISGRSTLVLNWMERLQIAADAAQGLEYLHNGCKPPIIHRDMKTSNILLNEKMQAKIADFGLSRILASESASHLSTTPAGTFGYIDPEIHSSGNITKKSDVYSFGVVLLELITGQPAIIWGEEYSTHILSWIKPLIEEGNIENIVDSRLRGAIENCSVWKAVEVAISCTLPTSEQRPEMSCVVMELTECLKMVHCITQQIPSEYLQDCSYASVGSESILTPR